jgi:acyl-CoA reductase-like NAD-dependent aldehyde dehydrogenase
VVLKPAPETVLDAFLNAGGRAIAEACGRLLRPVTLELGGKSAAVVLDDADLASTMSRSSARPCSTTARSAG